MTRNAPRIGSLGLSLALALLIGGCGGGSSSSATTATPATTATQASTTTATAAVTAPVVHLSVLSPHAGAHTGSTVTVHVALSGAPTGGTPHLRYVLDHRISRSGSTTLTFHELAPGRHQVEVLLGPGSSGRASTTFIVRAPVPVAAAVPVATETQHTTTTAPAPPVTTSTPEPVHTTPKAPPAKASPPESSGSIPQGNGGDGDGDNNGGPSDGDGNI